MSQPVKPRTVSIVTHQIPTETGYALLTVTHSQMDAAHIISLQMREEPLFVFIATNKLTEGKVISRKRKNGKCTVSQL